MVSAQRVVKEGASLVYLARNSLDSFSSVYQGKWQTYPDRPRIFLIRVFFFFFFRVTGNTGHRVFVLFLNDELWKLIG